MLDFHDFRTDHLGNESALLKRIRDSELLRKPRKNGTATSSGEKGEKDLPTYQKVIDWDKEWYDNDQRMIVNGADKKKLSKEVGRLMKEVRNQNGEEKAKTLAIVEELKENIATITQGISDASEKREIAAYERNQALKKVGNILHPVYQVEGPEEVVLEDFTFWPMNEEGKVGKVDYQQRFEGLNLLNHVFLLEKVYGMDTDRGAKVAGSRGYYLLNDIVLLNQALIQYGMMFLKNAKNPVVEEDLYHYRVEDDHGYNLIHTPFFMKEEVMEKCAQLEDYEDQLYGVYENDKASRERTRYLIATSEQTISSFHMNERIIESSFPIRYGGYSSCFRKEAGKHGFDTSGIFRTHQFEKVEQFVLTSPKGSESEKEFHRMWRCSAAFLKSLGIPFRVVRIAADDLNNSASIKYDIEGWFPFSQTYKELVSCSNCTDYQSRSLDIRYGQNRGKMEKIDETGKTTTKKEPTSFAHMLNGTLCATERTICCIVENYQTADGIKIPQVLQKFMGGVEMIKWADVRPDDELDGMMTPAEKDKKKKEKRAKKKKGQEK